MATRKKTVSASVSTTAQTEHPLPARLAVSPDILKQRFGPHRIPLANDFASLIDMADAGCRAAGQASDQDGNAGAGLTLDQGRLTVLAQSGAGIRVGPNGLGLSDDMWQRMMAASYGATLIAEAEGFTAFSTPGISTVYLHPRNNYLPMTLPGSLFMRPIMIDDIHVLFFIGLNSMISSEEICFMTALFPESNIFAGTKITLTSTNYVDYLTETTSFREI